MGGVGSTEQTSRAPLWVDRSSGDGRSKEFGSGGLSDLDQVPVGVTQVAADLAAEVLGWSDEDRTARAPLVVDGLDVRNPDVQEAAGAGRVRRRLQDHVWLVDGGPTADVDDDPRVSELDDRRLALHDRFPAEHVGVKGARALDILGDDEVGEQDALAGARALGHGVVSFGVIVRPLPDSLAVLGLNPA